MTKGRPFTLYRPSPTLGRGESEFFPRVRWLLRPDNRRVFVAAVRSGMTALRLGAHCRQELARRLIELGYRTETTMIDGAPGFEIAGYPRAMVDAFSSRCLVRKFHRFAKRGRGDACIGKANASQGAQAYP